MMDFNIQTLTGTHKTVLALTRSSERLSFLLQLTQLLS